MQGVSVTGIQAGQGASKAWKGRLMMLFVGRGVMAFIYSLAQGFLWPLSRAFHPLYHPPRSPSFRAAETSMPIRLGSFQPKRASSAS